jgi:hypothetical protein
MCVCVCACVCVCLCGVGWGGGPGGSTWQTASAALPIVALGTYFLCAVDLIWTSQGPNVTLGALLLVLVLVHSAVCGYVGRRLVLDFTEDDPKFDRWGRFNPVGFKWGQRLCVLGVGTFSLAFSKLLGREELSAQADTADVLFDTLRRLGAWCCGVAVTARQQLLPCRPLHATPPRPAPRRAVHHVAMHAPYARCPIRALLLPTFTIFVCGWALWRCAADRHVAITVALADIPAVAVSFSVVSRRVTSLYIVPTSTFPLLAVAAITMVINLVRVTYGFSTCCVKQCVTRWLLPLPT